MQSHTLRWDDLRHLLAVARGGTLSEAARRLGVDMTTVSRRLSALERAAGRPLFERRRGRLVPTEAGARAIAHAERMEAETIGLEAAFAGSDAGPRGRVRISAVPLVANRLLIPRLGGLLARHPGLELAVAAEGRNVSLAGRDADIALRFARPSGGDAVCRRLATIPFSLWGPAGHGGEATALPWIGYDETAAELPQARWIEQRPRAGEAVALRVGDLESAEQAVAAGLGRSPLPDFVGEGDDRLARLSEPGLLDRELWLLVDRRVRALPRVAAVVDWLEEAFSETPAAGREPGRTL